MKIRHNNCVQIGDGGGQKEKKFKSAQETRSRIKTLLKKKKKKKKTSRVVV